MNRSFCLLLFAFAISIMAQELDTPSDYPIIEEYEIHGCLIAEGNSVYIPKDSPNDYEKAGQIRLNDVINRWGYWKVVPTPEQAHFVLQFTTQTIGKDYSALIIRPRKYYRCCPQLLDVGGTIWNTDDCIGIVFSSMGSSENIEDNIKAAKFLGEHIKKVLSNSDGRLFKSFFKEFDEILDANSENNNYQKKRHKYGYFTFF